MNSERPLTIQDVDLLLLGGLQGSGKSTLATSLFSDRRRVNRDDIRSFYKTMTTGEPWRPGDWHPRVEPLVTAVEDAVLAHVLGGGERVVIDNTLIDRRLRAPYIQRAQERGRSVGCLFLAAPLEVCLERNRRRPRQVPEPILREFYASIELPCPDEGLDVVQILHQPVSGEPEDLTGGASELLRGLESLPFLPTGRRPS